MTQSGHPKLSAVEAALVRIGTEEHGFGSGFVIGGKYIVTAAHCLQRLPDPLGLGSRPVLVHVSKRSDPSKKCIAYALFCDHVSDLAVLAEPDPQTFSEFAEGYEKFIESHESLKLIGRLLKPGCKDSSRYFVISPQGVCYSGDPFIAGYTGRYVHLYLHATSEIDLSGSSGSAIVDEEGAVVGVLTSGGHNEYHSPVLRDHLPAWLM